MRASRQLSKIANSVLDTAISDGRLDIDPLGLFTLRLGLGAHHRVYKSDLIKAMKKTGAPDAWIERVDAANYDAFHLRGWTTWIMDCDDADPNTVIATIADIYPCLPNADDTYLAWKRAVQKT